MRIHRLDLASRRDVRRYITFPFQLYRQDNLWVPPFVSQATAQLDPDRNPFFQHSDAAFFIALDGHQVVGRIAVLDNARYNEYSGERTAFFYHFDAVNNIHTSRALCGAAMDWARQRGLDQMWGPKGFVAGDGQGLLVEGFEHRPAMSIAYNYPYYGELLENAGFTQDLDFISGYIDREIGIPDRFLELAEKVKQRRGFHVQSFNSKEELQAMIPHITALYNSSFVQVRGFVPITEAEARVFANRILAVADPTLVKLLLREKEIVGFILAYPDLSAGIQRCRGRLWPTGWIHLLRESKHTHWLNFNGAGILEPYRGLGGNALLYAEMFRTLLDRPQFLYGDLVQVQETNFRMMQELEAAGVKLYKRHRIYQRAL